MSAALQIVEREPQQAMASRMNVPTRDIWLRRCCAMTLRAGLLNLKCEHVGSKSHSQTALPR